MPTKNDDSIQYLRHFFALRVSYRVKNRRNLKL